MCQAYIMQPIRLFKRSESADRAFCAGIIPLAKRLLLYNKKFPLSEKISSIDDEDPELVDSAYDNFLAPLFEETLFALIPVLVFPGSLMAFVCFRAAFLLFHLVETDLFGKVRFGRISVHRLFIPIVVSIFAVLSKRFDVALVSHVIMNALITPVINKFFGMNLLKAVIPLIAREQKVRMSDAARRKTRGRTELLPIIFFRKNRHCVLPKSCNGDTLRNRK
jgi:hypothetical protein